jgi:hypothetical protein
MIALRNRQCDAARPLSFPPFHSASALPITLMQLERVSEEAHEDGAAQHRGGTVVSVSSVIWRSRPRGQLGWLRHSDDEPPATNLAGPKRSHSAAFD